MRRKLSHRLPDGTCATRMTENPYTHVVVARTSPLEMERARQKAAGDDWWAKQYAYYQRMPWGVHTWSRNEANARKRATQLARYDYVVDVHVEPITPCEGSLGRRFRCR
jgi:hypothetical protein